MLTQLSATLGAIKFKDGKKLDFILNHWHCVVPLLLIAAVLLLRRRGKQEANK
jgi:hypothetical protein